MEKKEKISVVWMCLIHRLLLWFLGHLLNLFCSLHDGLL